MILYQDTGGNLTRRRITMLKLSAQHGHEVLYAYCVEAEALRSFRLSSIQEFVTTDGEVIAPADFWSGFGIDPIALAKSNASSTTVEKRLARVANAHLVILTGLSDCDGQRDPAEVESILSYVEIEHERDEVYLDPVDIRKLARKIRIMQPTDDMLRVAMDQVFGVLPVGKKPKTEMREKQMLIRAMRQVVLADGRVAEEELDFLAQRLGFDTDVWSPDNLSAETAASAATFDRRPPPPQKIQQPTLKGLLGYTIAFTGQFDAFSRSEAKSLVESRGGVVAGSVTHEVNLVVIGKDAGAKAKRAEQLDVRCLSEAEFIKLIRQCDQ